MADGSDADNRDDEAALERADCVAVIEELYTFLDGELTEVRRLQITRHLDGCTDCHEVVDFHAELKMAISAKCKEPLPDGLRQRVERALGMPGL
jgi:mycothiol system anti-sigma-R factor